MLRHDYTSAYGAASWRAVILSPGPALRVPLGDLGMKLSTLQERMRKLGISQPQ
jgi:hypothetical protein